MSNEVVLGTIFSCSFVDSKNSQKLDIAVSLHLFLLLTIFGKFSIHIQLKLAILFWKYSEHQHELSFKQPWTSGGDQRGKQKLHPTKFHVESLCKVQGRRNLGTRLQGTSWAARVSIYH